jgi:hypothetical protein
MQGGKDADIYAAEGTELPAGKREPRDWILPSSSNSHSFKDKSSEVLELEHG